MKTEAGKDNESSSGAHPIDAKEGDAGLENRAGAGPNLVHFYFTQRERRKVEWQSGSGQAEMFF
jgi:hypothetical protein